MSADYLLTGRGEPLRAAGGATATTQTGHAVANTGAGATIQVGTLDDCRNQLLATQGEVIRLQGLLLARQA